MDRSEMRLITESVAKKLMLRLSCHEISKIDIDTIRAQLANDVALEGLTPFEADQLEEIAIRTLVTMVG